MNKKLLSIVRVYRKTVKEVDNKASTNKDRAYGGIVRSTKGNLVENIGKKLTKIAWEEIGRKGKLNFVNSPIKIPMKEDYLDRIKDPEVKNYIQKNIKEMCYYIKPDIQVYIDDEFRMSIECKAYTENAMLKRILVDCMLIKYVYPNATFVLLQLESQLGGDYSSFISGRYGSPSTHTLFSYFDIDLNIITLLEGERKVDQPIHKPYYYKPLKVERLKEAVEIFKNLLVPR
jgi:hypothetical protein